MAQPGKEIKIHLPQDIQGGVYANNMFVMHTREEFILDFIMAVPPTGSVTARVITSPSHLKRIIAALQENLKKYETAFGEIKLADEPKGALNFEGGYL